MTYSLCNLGLAIYAVVMIVRKQRAFEIMYSPFSGLIFVTNVYELSISLFNYTCIGIFNLGVCVGYLLLYSIISHTIVYLFTYHTMSN